ncbi:MOSC domain-containing protein [Pseudanabaena sp. FACHB-2040]|uniref:MOSC domain-containing protein n=1 Tax=Pseudanabaena sp. FACHB-2040 TaxID=2692859 RepID=UPI0016867E40|nr:MOSC domain-containing protein [Pseudanabaena sp. FACHB-2040]MBD2258755.1 MOSC domain-containing protein [Pseudanabaena sp. FACHB-2040]
MTTVGVIESIWRYPVKSMSGEQLDEVFVAFSGVMGDRLYGLINDKGNPGFPWHTAREQEDLLQYKPRYKHHSFTLKPKQLEAAQSLAPGVNPLYPDAEHFAVEVETPSGQVYDLGSEEFMSHLRTLTNSDTLRLHFTQKNQYDCRPLSLFSQQTCDRLSEELEMDVDKRRFRANFYITWNDGKPPLYENELVGQRLRIGDRLEISILERDPRCKVITLDPETSEANPKVIKHVAQAYEGYAGIYGAVLVEGVVKAGDSIELVA